MKKQDPSKKLEELGKKLVRDIDNGKNPTIEFSLRSLSNVIFDEKSKILTLGDKTQQRSFFNVL